MLSYVQHKILTALLTTKGEERYSKIKPKDVENDLFNYHLKYLIGKKYIQKKNQKYSLTRLGKSYVLNMDALGRLKNLFKVSVICIVLRNNKEILVQRRKRHPYYDDVHAISGKVETGEDFETAAKRKLLEETGLDASFQFIGVIRKTRKDEALDVFEDTLFHYCYTHSSSGKLIKENTFGENFWVSTSEALELEKQNKTTGKYSQLVLKNITKKDLSPFYYHEKTLVKV